jgi:hypothetical protein
MITWEICHESEFTIVQQMIDTFQMNGSSGVDSNDNSNRHTTDR